MSFNLIGDPWIPVVRSDGAAATVGLRELYERAEDIRDLALTPPERIAVMRLLLCITHAALDGPRDRADWRACRERIVPESLRYLDGRRERFDLFGERPFMQMYALTAEKPGHVDALDDRLALFDQKAYTDDALRTTAWAARGMLTLLNFSRCGRIGQGIHSGQRLTQQTYAAPCIGALHAFIQLGCMRETIWMNLLNKAQVCEAGNDCWGKPVWDQFPTGPKDIEAIRNAAQTYLGRLVPLTRLLLASQHPESENCVAREVIISPTWTTLDFRFEKMKGIFPPFVVPGKKATVIREPSTAVIASSAGDLMVLPIDLDKHTWREAASVLAASQRRDKGGFLAVENLRDRQAMGDAPSRSIQVWTGGMRNENNASIEDTAEWIFSFDWSLIEERTLGIYEQGVALANIGATHLKKAVEDYFKNVASSNSKSVKKEAETLTDKAIPRFWSILDSKYGQLVSIAEKADPMEPWRKTVEAAMHRAYDATCPQATPRQIQAWAQGRRYLTLKEKKSTSKKGGRA